jgi:hypothetical protein
VITITPSTIKPSVSIVIPVFNRADLIVENLDSLIRQTFPEWEALVVDDGSTDATCDVINRLAAADPRIRLIRRDRAPKGANTCRNIGLAAARADLVIFLDSDDLLAPGCLQQRTKVMRENPGLPFAIFQGTAFFHTPGDTDQIWNQPGPGSDLDHFLRGNSVWQTAGPIWSKTILQELGGFDEDLGCWQDVDLHIRALSRGLGFRKFLNLPPDYFYRRHFGDTLSQGAKRSRENVAGLLKLCDKLAIIPALNRTAGEKTGVRFMFARQIFLALDNQFLDLALEGIRLAQRNGIMSPTARIAWRAAFACYRLRARGFRGFAWLGERLCQPYLPPRDTLFSPLSPKTDGLIGENK